jgi:IS4 transposase
MALDVVLERFVKHSPTTVITRLLLERAFESTWIDELFEAHGEAQYTRQLLFSTTVDLLSTVALGLQPSVNAAAKVAKDLPVSLAALYAKINNTSPVLVRALVQGSARRMMSIREALPGDRGQLIPGYKVKVVDGNHLPASEKRLAVLRSFRGGALPGHSLVVYEPELGLVTDIVPCEDAYTQERVLMPALIESAAPGELWLADRNFSTAPIVLGFARRCASFLIREHSASPNPAVRGDLRKIGRVDTGTVYEQPVESSDDSGVIALRRIELHLFTPTDSGETIIRLLTNLPSSNDARELAILYRSRWTIEGMFQWLESVLNSEVRTLGYPRAALFAFGIAVLAFNALSVTRYAIEVAHDLDPTDPAGLSFYYMAVEVGATMTGMEIAVPEEVWQPILDLPIPRFAQLILRIAQHVDVRKLQKHPRGPKSSGAKGSVPSTVARSHTSTARALAAGKVVK